MRTPLCDLLGIDVPIVLAAFGHWEQVELDAAVSNAGGLGSVGTVARTPDELSAVGATRASTIVVPSWAVPPSRSTRKGRST
jgi:NAD(P)H-dependent flavin oxidoreductase YrpB (nitropropane dioxygenase family)